MLTYGAAGGLLALMLADGYTPQQIKNIYWYHLVQVFSIPLSAGVIN
jgi:hypothetical protein